MAFLNLIKLRMKFIAMKKELLEFSCYAKEVKVDPELFIHPNVYPYQEYADRINQWIAEIIERDRYAEFHFFAPETIAPCFWRIVEGEAINCSDIHTKIATYIGIEINNRITLAEERIQHEIMILEKDWNAYLGKIFFMKHFNKINPLIITKLLFSNPMSKDMASLKKQLMRSNAHLRDLKVLLDSDQFTDFWVLYLEKYKLLFNIFEKTSRIIGAEIGRLENKSLYNLNTIYQLSEGTRSRPGRRTPVGYKTNLNQLLILLKRLKNAIVSHGNYNSLDPQHIEIWDESPNTGKEIFRKVYAPSELYNIFYLLMILQRGFRRVALFYSLSEDIAKYSLFWDKFSK